MFLSWQRQAYIVKIYILRSIYKSINVSAVNIIYDKHDKYVNNDKL